MYEELGTIERRIRFELSRGRAASAATSAVSFFGPEIYGFITVAMADAHGAREVYSSLVADLPRALHDFSWRCHLRIFLYHAARRALRLHREGSGAAARLALQLPMQVRVAGISPHRRQHRLAVASLRSALPPGDREILILRLDRRMRWSELAVTSLGEAASSRERRGEAQRLRQRFSALRRMVKQLTQRSARHGGPVGEDA